MAISKSNGNDLESPGYDFLRSFQNMSNLYYKLLALNYHKDFCNRYKCPPIHRYYFSLPHRSPSEQQFMFACLCAWLIKEKCQMNFDLDPEEYQEPEVTVTAVLDAIKLLLVSDDDVRGQRNFLNSLGFPASRLKTGYGPEIIWALNVLADRALELLFSLDPSTSDQRQVRPVYWAKSSSPSTTAGGNRRAGGQAGNSISIGLPFVGGGLTTRPLGTYQVEDPSLELEESDGDIMDDTGPESKDLDLPNAADWLREVEEAAGAIAQLETLADQEDLVVPSDGDLFQRFNQLELSKQMLKKLEEVENSTSSSRITRQQQLIQTLERSLEQELGDKLPDFELAWRNYSSRQAENQELVGQVELATDKFELLNERLREAGNQLELRFRQLSDGSRLKALEESIAGLRSESAELDFEIGVLLSIYGRVQAELVKADY